MLLTLLSILAAGIVDLNPANDVLPDLLSARQVMNNSPVKSSVTLLQFSDLHGDCENLARIVEFKDAYSDYVEDAVHVGDVVAGYYDNPNPWDQVAGARACLNVVGNHDCWKGYKLWSESNHPYDATQEDAYRKILVGQDTRHPFVTGWGVVQPKGVDKKNSADFCACYYYKDYVSAGVRLIALDCVHYFDAQHKWLENTLADAAKKGLCVVVAVHYPAQHGLRRIDSGFSSEFQIAFVPDPGESQMERTPDAAFSAVDGFIAAGGTFVCWLSGHEHYDYVGYVDGHKPQLQIIVDKGGEKDIYMEEDRTRGTKNQDSFNLVTINASKHFLAVQRIGCTRNEKMQSKRLFCYDYVSDLILVNE